MGTAPLSTIFEADPTRYLCVDRFLRTLAEARGLQCALELGLIDALLSREPQTAAEMSGRLGIAPRGMDFLLALLRAAGVLDVEGNQARLSAPFRAALEFRDLLEAKLEFTATVLPDFLGLFNELIGRPGEFMGRSEVFNLFRYDRCFHPGEENYRLTRRWVRYTTALTRYEAEVCLHHHDFGRYGRLLDIGGNSGEFALRLCRRHRSLQATVFDLPLVCDIGAEHVAGEPESERIRFVRGDARQDPLPDSQDVVTFKSFLHDWPEQQALQFLGRAGRSLRPGGTLLIFERGVIRVGMSGIPYSMIPNIVFLHFFRSPQTYASHLENAGYEQIEIRQIELEMPFFLLTATKPRH